MGAQEKVSAPSNSMQRVKVYRLNDDGKWEDQGTGHVTVDYLERSEELGLFVIDEEDNETLLLHRICAYDIYRKKEETIISWKDPEYPTELALSFQETTGCSYIWDHICNVQRNMHFDTLNNKALAKRQAKPESEDIEDAPEPKKGRALVRQIHDDVQILQADMATLQVKQDRFQRDMREISLRQLRLMEMEHMVWHL